nr:unnamed protein product [Digitaria exilis]
MTACARMSSGIANDDDMAPSSPLGPLSRRHLIRSSSRRRNVGGERTVAPAPSSLGQVPDEGTNPWRRCAHQPRVARRSPLAHRHRWIQQRRAARLL